MHDKAYKIQGAEFPRASKAARALVEAEKALKKLQDRRKDLLVAFFEAEENKSEGKVAELRGKIEALDSEIQEMTARCNFKMAKARDSFGEDLKAIKANLPAMEAELDKRREDQEQELARRLLESIFLAESLNIASLRDELKKITGRLKPTPGYEAVTPAHPEAERLAKQIGENRDSLVKPTSWMEERKEIANLKRELNGKSRTGSTLFTRLLNRARRGE